MNEPLSASLKILSDMPNVTLVELTGDFDNTSQQALQTIEAKVQNAAQNEHLIVDLSGIHFLNSYAIGQLVAWRNALNPKSGRVLIIGASASVSEIFSILGITELFELQENLEAAKKALA